MCYKKLLLAISFVITANLVHAVVFKSSVTSGKAKAYVYAPSGRGHLQLNLVYDSVGSDLDLAVGVRDANRNLLLLAVSEAATKQFERLEIGVDPAFVYEIYVVSARGGSKYRLHITTALEVIDLQFQSSATTVEMEIDSTSRQMLDHVHAIQKFLKP